MTKVDYKDMWVFAETENGTVIVPQLGGGD